MKKLLSICDLPDTDEHTEVLADYEDVEFVGPDGIPRKLDLCNNHKREFDRFKAELAMWSKLGAVSDAVAKPRRTHTASPDNAHIRAWARANQMQLGDRGRIPPDVRKAWEAAGRPTGAPLALVPVAAPNGAAPTF